MIKVTGRVQGVGFRWFVKQTANQMKLTGWVQNQWDGSVTMEVQGQEEVLAGFQNALRYDHPYANVETLLALARTVIDDEKAFYIRG
jgi:acylphosphatase